MTGREERIRSALRSGGERTGALARAARFARPNRRSEKRSLAQILLARGAVTAANLQEGRRAATGTAMSYGDVLQRRGILTEAEHLSALSEEHRIGLTDLRGGTPDPTLARLFPIDTALELEAVPWRRAGAAIVVATCRPGAAAALSRYLPPGRRMILTLAPRAQILAAQTALYGDALARVAEGQAPAAASCRGWRPKLIARVLSLLVIALLILAAIFPAMAAGLVFGLALTVFGANMVLKVAAFAATLRADRTAPGHEEASRPAAAGMRNGPAVLHLPEVSLIVPLYKERAIASTLIANLSRLDYPAERLDVLLAVEADDDLTLAAIERCALPPWVRCIAVPPGAPRTKPRALNFALNFARGSIIGIYDAEDRPEPDQILRVVRRFAELPGEVACLQGRLDYYNRHLNWVARCFTIEYAGWFRVLLPGVQRLGLFVPLGGTTVFLRRDVLRRVGGWDAHNVTEDAELGLRLARRGYRTEIVDTTTFEEANAAIRPWIAQRSRWQKGYLMTWGTAMRHPLSLMRDLGWRRFIGFQVQVLFAVLGFLVAPLLWSLALIPFGVAHPLAAILSPVQLGALAVAMVSSLVLSVALSLRATRRAHLQSLRPWILMSELYYLLATISAWRATIEMLADPFWWEKTQHGAFGGLEPESTSEATVEPIAPVIPQRG